MSTSDVPFLALSCIGAFATAPAWGADEPRGTTPPLASDEGGADEAQRRGDIVVVGDREHRGDDAKAVAPLVNTPRSVIVLPRAVIEQTGSTTLQDALRTVPGITFGAAEGGNPIGDRPFIRGFDSQGSIYVDGVRDLASQTREVFTIDSIQVVHGSDSTLGGRGSAGGTINIVTKQPQLDDVGSVQASYGNADYKRVTADLNVALSDTAAFRVAGVWHDQDVAGRDAVYARRWGVAPSVTIGLGTPTRLTASYYHLESHELPDSGIPYLYTIANAPGTGAIHTRPAIGTVTTAGGQTGYVDRANFYGLITRDFRDATTDQAQLRVEHDFGGVTLRNTARFTHNDQRYIFTLPDDSQGNVYGTTATNSGWRLTSGGYVWRRGNTRDSNSESIVDQTDLFGKVTTGGIEHSIAIGAELSWEKARRGTLVSASGFALSPRCTTASVARYYCTSLFAPDPSDPWVNYASDTSGVATPIVRAPSYTDILNDARTQSVYGFDSITLTPRLIVNLGVRYDRFTSVTQPGVATGDTPRTRIARTDNLFNWQAGVVFKPTAATSVYASYATAATPPNSLLGEGREDNATIPGRNDPATLTVESLKVQKTRSYEIGAKANLFGERLALGLAGFQTDIRNARVTDADNTVSFIGVTRIRGVELSVNGTILPGWTVFGGYTFLDAVIVDGGFTALTAAAVGGQAAQAVTVRSVNTGKRVPQTARNAISLSTNLALTKRLQIGGGAYYLSRQYGGYAEDRRAVQTAAGVVTVIPATKTLYREIPGYWRFDARASYALTDRVSLSVNAQNLTDETYFTQTYTNHYASIAAGRTVFGTIGVSF
ncbi:TonB-dependent receptor [Sphingomonas oligophenolica]|uniref:TonB-dependent receptor n=1 Tax=Sphingomonas oligophenolica TaxID=301154 RepID=UPI001F4FF4D5|nr:TonB-dependent siderophore receptor [Sphingomonas oligophenolica]